MENAYEDCKKVCRVGEGVGVCVWMYVCVCVCGECGPYDIVVQTLTVLIAMAFQVVSLLPFSPLRLLRKLRTMLLLRPSGWR